MTELEMLESMFPSTDELRIEEPSVIHEIENYMRKESVNIPPFLDIIINLTVDNAKIELSISLPHEYPNIEPDIYIRNQKLNKTQHANINRDCTDYMKQRINGEPCIYSVISWIMDNFSNYIAVEQITEVPVIKARDDRLVRYWIYSHHIYSKTKRREMLNLAQKLNISGFCMPGKPGVICIEGEASECDDWWATIKSLPWKRIFCKATEECKKMRFQGFEEVTFQPNGLRSNHCDLGEFGKYLDKHEVGYIFKELFGVEAKNNS